MPTYKNAEPKYKVLVRGQKFACTICGTIYEGSNCRNFVMRCYESHQERNIGRHSFLPLPRLDKAPGEGVEYPDIHGQMMIELNEMTKPEFNLRFMAALDGYPAKAKHLGTGSGGRPPLLRTVLLSNARDDIKTMGFDQAKGKWGRFIGYDSPDKPAPQPEPPPLPVILDVTPLFPDYGLPVNLFTGQAVGGRQMKLLAAKKSETAHPSKKGRPCLDIDLKLICDALEHSSTVGEAAQKVGTSRAYIYKVVKEPKSMLKGDVK